MRKRNCLFTTKEFPSAIDSIALHCNINFNQNAKRPLLPSFPKGIKYCNMTLNDYKEKPRQKAFCVKFNAGCSESNLRLKFVSISPFFFSFATNLLHSPAFQHSQMFLKATKITFTFNYFHFQPKYCFAICWVFWRVCYTTPDH